MGGDRRSTACDGSSSISVTHARPSSSPTTRAGTTSSPGGGRVERQPAHRQRAGTRKAQRVVGFDRREPCRDVVGREARRDARRDDAGLVVQPREPVGVDLRDEVVAGIDLAGDRPEASGCGRGGHARVAVSTRTEPPVRVWCCASVKPASPSASASTDGVGRYAVDFGQVRVGVGVVRERAPEERHRAAEPDRVPRPHQRVRGHRGVEGDEATSRAEDARDLAEHGGELDEVAQREPADDAVEAAVAERKLGRVGPNEGSTGVGGGEHSRRVVDADGAVAAGHDVVGEVAGATGEVEDQRPFGKIQLGHRVLAPTAVEPERDHPVHAVVLGCEPVEHPLDGAVLLVALGE